MTGSELAVATPEDIALLQQQQEEEFDSDLLQTPILKIGQPLTREVENGDAEAGEFINTLTSEGLGNKVGFITAFYQKGRFATDDDDKAYVAFSSTIPEAWEPLVGAEFVGTPFAEHPDAEETFKTRVNNKEIEWGSGPDISTTHNFTGLVIVNPLEGEEGDAELQPVRLSLQRTAMPAVRKWLTLKKSQRNSAFWDRVYDLGTEQKEFKKGRAYLPTIKLGRQTTAEEKAAAVELASAVAAGRTQSNEAAEAVADKPVEPDAQGGLAV